MKKNALLLTVAFATISLLASCLKTDEPAASLNLQLPDEPFNYADTTMPQHMMIEFLRNAPGVFNSSGSVTGNGGFVNIDGEEFFIDEFGFINTSASNPTITNDGATLGRVLFYDTKLSINNAVSCASCHKQQFAFSDPTAGSKGFEGKVTPRNSMAIVNVALNRNLFWDSRVHSAKQLTLEPVQNHIEMGMEDLSVLVNKLSKTDYYPQLFEKAFGSSTITKERISDAMAQFICSMVSVNTPFDAFVAGNQDALNQLELKGFSLFHDSRTKCAQCHSGNNFAADDQPGGEYGSIGFNDGGPKGTANNGLDLFTTDAGLKDGQFRIPTLRNIALTGPYMHDGRFKTLEEVIDFYDSGVKLHPSLDKKLIGPDGEPLRLNLSALEKKALVAFLESLTDQTLISHEKFSNPFH